MNKQLIASILYLSASASLFAYAFLTNTLFLYLGILLLVIALFYSRHIKK